MENSIYVGLSRQMVLKTNMDIIANNIANANTVGFRGQNLLFKEFVSNPHGTDAPLSFVEDFGQYKATDQGAMQYTGNPLNVAVVGPAYMGVVGPDGKVAYTRAGEFQMSKDGTLVTPAGYPVADQGGAAITIPNNSSEIHIDNKGIVSNQSGQIGQIMMVEFDSPQKLTPLGSSLYQTSEAAKPAEKSTMKQGVLEGSNVQPVIEMTRMIDTLRSFQNVQQVLSSENDRLRSAIQHLTQQA
jgi:flagellar basal-body rod protein FlgF